MTRSQEEKMMEGIEVEVIEKMEDRKEDGIARMEAQVEEVIERMKNFREVLQEVEVLFQEIDNMLLQGAAGLLILLFLLAAFIRQ